MRDGAGRLVSARVTRLRLRVADHEASPHRVIRLACQFVVRRVEGGQPQTVGVAREGLVAVEDESSGLVERDGEASGQPKCVSGPDLFHERFDDFRVDRVGPLPGEAKHDRLVGGVPPACQGQRPVQIGTDPPYAPEDAARFQHPDEAQGRPHRADRVRAARGPGPHARGGRSVGRGASVDAAGRLAGVTGRPRVTRDGQEVFVGRPIDAGARPHGGGRHAGSDSRRRVARPRPAVGLVPRAPARRGRPSRARGNACRPHARQGDPPARRARSSRACRLPRRSSRRARGRRAIRRGVRALCDGPRTRQSSRSAAGRRERLTPTVFRVRQRSRTQGNAMAARKARKPRGPVAGLPRPACGRGRGRRVRNECAAR